MKSSIRKLRLPLFMFCLLISSVELGLYLYVKLSPDKRLLWEFEPYTDHLFLKTSQHLKHNHPDFIQDDLILGWDNRRNFQNDEITTDHLGARRSFPTNEGANIVLIGDSYTFGLEVRDHQTLASQLNTQFPQRNFINFGVSGFGHDQMFLKLKQLLKQSTTPIEKVILIYVRTDSYRNEMIARPIAKPYFSLLDDKMIPLSTTKSYQQLSWSLALYRGIAKNTPRKTTLITAQVMKMFQELADQYQIDFQIIELPQLYMDHKKQQLSEVYIKYEENSQEWHKLSSVLRKYGIKHKSYMSELIEWAKSSSVYDPNYKDHWSPKTIKKMASLIGENLF